MSQKMGIRRFMASLDIVHDLCQPKGVVKVTVNLQIMILDKDFRPQDLLREKVSADFGTFLIPVRHNIVKTGTITR